MDRVIEVLWPYATVLWLLGSFVVASFIGLFIEKFGGEE